MAERENYSRQESAAGNCSGPGQSDRASERRRESAPGQSRQLLRRLRLLLQYGERRQRHVDTGNRANPGVFRKRAQRPAKERLARVLSQEFFTGMERPFHRTGPNAGGPEETRHANS